MAQLVWNNPGEMPETMSKWTAYTDLVQIVQEMGMRQMMFRQHYESPDEEILTTRMKDMILTSGPPGTFISVATILTPFIDRRIHKLTETMANLGDMEVKRTEKGLADRATKGSQVQKGKPKRKEPEGPIKASRRQMWFDLVAAGVSPEKIDQQPNEILLALWCQLRPDQRFQKPATRNKTAREVQMQGFMESEIILD